MNKYLLIHPHYCIINNCTHGIWYYIIRMQSDEDVSDQRKLSVTHSKTQWGAAPAILPLLFSCLLISEEICIQRWLHLV